MLFESKHRVTDSLGHLQQRDVRWLRYQISVVHFMCCLSCGSAHEAADGHVPPGGTLGLAGSPSNGNGQWSGGAGASGTGGIGTGGIGDASSSAADQGLCQVSMKCPSEVVDEPEVLCEFAIHNAEGALVYSDYAGVELRGHSSLGFPKHNYRVELRTAANVDNPSPLLGLGKEADWILDGMWVDRSLMRNRLMYDLFRAIAPSRWAPQARFCELTRDARFDGVYSLVEKIKRDDDRIDIPQDDGTGSTFIVRQTFDGTLEMPGMAQPFELVYPKQSTATPTQVAAIQGWLDALGTATMNGQWQDVLNFLDFDAAIDWILLEEFSKNVDAYIQSIHFARVAGGLAWIVPWDFDLSFGQPTEDGQTNESPEGWCYKRSALLRSLSPNPDVLQALGPRWRSLRQGILSESSIGKRLDEFAMVLTPEVTTRNFERWPIADIDFSVVFPPLTMYDVSSYEAEMAHFRGWITARLKWLDSNIDDYPMY